MVEHKKVNSQRMSKTKTDETYVELRFKVPQSLKQNLKILGKAKGISTNRMGTLLVNELLAKKPDLISAMETSIAIVQLEKKIEPSYHQLFTSYSLLTSTEIPEGCENFFNKCRDFQKSADLFVQTFNVG